MTHLPEYETTEKWMIQQAAKNHIPINGTLELLPLCNLNCDMCYVHLSGKDANRLGRIHSADEWIQLAGEMAEDGVLFLMLTGGEPLLFPDFKRLYEEIKKLGMILTINTNGTLIDEEWADFFAEDPPRRINITLYGSNAGTYEKVCHDARGYDRALRGIKLLRERNIDTKINSSAVKGNRSDLEEIYRIGIKLGCPVHTDTYMLPGLKDRFKPFEQQSRLNPADAARTQLMVLKHEMTEERFQEYVETAIRQCSVRDSDYDDGFVCQAGCSSFAIDWQGNMHPCISMSEPSVSVFETGFSDAWKQVVSEKDFIRLNKKCCKCHLRSVCQTCVAAAHWETGAYDKIPPYICQLAEETYALLKKEYEQYET